MTTKAQHTISFKASLADYELISKIVDRAERDGVKFDRQTMTMDLVATHANGCQMDFQKLLDAPAFVFSHDIAGIYRHIDRDTGELMNCFVPRCAASH
jgi:hypothetical protein